MTRNPLDLLRAADPVPRPVGYPEDEVATRVADILAHDGQLPAPLGAAPERRTRSRWLPAGLVAAAVLVLAVVSAVVLTRGNDRNDAAGAAPVTCAVSPSGSTKAVRARLTLAETVITSRLTQLGGSASSFVTDPGARSVGFTPRGVSVVQAAQACRATTVAIRPVVAHLVLLDTDAPRAANPLSALTFTVPSTEREYAGLTATQQAGLAAAMSHYDCAHPGSATTAGLACISSGDQKLVILLGPALASGPDLRGARAVAPDTGSEGGVAEWTVDLSLGDAGARRLQAFTASHHSPGHGAELVPCGERNRTPCADFLAFAVGDQIDSVPLTSATLAQNVQLPGAYDRATAQALAADCTAAAVQLHPR